MNLCQLYKKYQEYSNKMSFYTLIIIAYAFILLSLFIGFLVTFSTVLLIILLVLLIGVFIMVLFIKKTNKKLTMILNDLNKIKIKESCYFENNIQMNIPRIYNIIDKRVTFDNLLVYKCQNQNKEYNFLKEAAKKIDEENNMLELIPFTNLKDKAVVTVEFIIKDDICILKCENNELTITSLENVSLRSDV